MVINYGSRYTDSQSGIMWNQGNPCRREGGRTVRAIVFANTRKTQPAEETKQYSEGLTETAETNTPSVGLY